MPGASADLLVPKDQIPRIHWENRGREIVARLSACRWDLGDWWLARPDRNIAAHDIADKLNLTASSIYAHGWLSRIFPPHRRRPVSHSHHHEVATLPPAVADDMLDQAVAGRWSVARIRQEARRAAHDQAVEAEREAAAAQRELTLEPTADAWRVDSRRIGREIRERTVTLEATAKAIVDAIEHLATHPGLEPTHGSRRRAVAQTLGSLLMPADTGIDLGPLTQPLLDRIWREELPEIPS